MGDEKISIKNKALILSICLIVIFMMGAVSAANQTDVIDAKETNAQDVITSDIAEDEPLGENQQSPAECLPQSVSRYICSRPLHRQ